MKKGKAAAHKILHANILLKVDANGPNWKDEQIAQAFACHTNTVCNVRQRFVEEGLTRALERKKQKSPSRQRILDGEKEARLIAIRCSEPPPGKSRWTLQLLADKLVELKIVETISAPSVGRAIKKMK